MPWTHNVDATDPPGSAAASGGAAELRQLKTDLMERMNALFADFNAQPLVPVVGFFMSGAGAPVSAVTGAGVANPGTHYFDTTNKVEYVNIGTKAVPTWAPIILGDSV